MANILENIAGGVSDFTSKIVNVFDNGFNIYTSIDDRLRAIKQISKETVVSNPLAVSSPPVVEQDINKQTQKSIQTASLALIAAGILFVLLLVLITKRKRG